MKTLLFGKKAAEIEVLVKSSGFEIVKNKPEVIISYGGDGTLLSSERQYPSIPKLPLRNNKFCNKCNEHQDKKVLKKLFDGKLKLKEYRKLETEILYKVFLSLNDFVIRNADPVHTVRFKTSVTNNKLFIGDGVVISTPFGSTGYFKSVTQQTFEKGFAIAFNNTTQKVEPKFLNETDFLIFQLIRGKATLSFDNNHDIFIIDEGSQLQFKLSNQVAKIYMDTSLRCSNCKILELR